VTTLVIEFAARCGHADVLRALLEAAEPRAPLGAALMIAFMTGFEAGRRLLAEAGATLAWTPSTVKVLNKLPGKAEKLSSILPLTGAIVESFRGDVQVLRRVIVELIEGNVVTPDVILTYLNRGGWFAHSPGLTHINIPLGITSIRCSAFYGCSNLKQLTIPSSVTTIGYKAFYGCWALTQLTIPANLQTIGNEDHDVFGNVRLKHLTLVGSPLSADVVANLENCLVPTAKVVGASLAGQRFGRFVIVAA
jgi:hypothetical protein